MILKALKLPIHSGRFVVVLNELDAVEIGVMEGDRLKVKFGKNSVYTTVQLTKEVVPPGSLGLSNIVASELKVLDDSSVEVHPTSKPKSVDYIKEKMKGRKLSSEELRAIIYDIVNNKLNEVEITSFVLGCMLKGMDFDEIEAMTRVMIESGERLYFDRGIVVNKHSIGGVPGNKISLLIVPIVASSGLIIPKTASRAITSASGTADTMEVLANVNLSVDEIKEICEKVNGVIAWGGSTNIAPADDKIIRIEHPLSIDPRPQLLASVMAKKGAVGAKYVVMDIPVGEGAKIESAEVAKSLANDFIELAKRLGIEMAAAITYGGQPIGRTIGPALEAHEALKALENRSGPASLVEKSLGIAGILFEISGIASNGYEMARNIFESGKAHEKFLQIIEAQGGKIFRSEDVPIGDKKYTITSSVEGAVVSVHNKTLVKIARAAGAPKDKGAGVYLHKKKGDVVKRGDPIITIYSEKDWKLDKAVEVARKEKPIIISGMVLEVVRRGVVL
ncbi:MAG: AMP phosphorylase [Archaeoglobaceae archaeon]|nr:AMP phosphorylase [Archaeoglobaceae archaeon]MDW8014299.1 AMP phosphorylase [Archaeoglobaceae archaeon]